MQVKLEDVCDRGTSNLRQVDVEGKTGGYPIFGAAGYIGNVDFFHQEKAYVAVVKDGAGIGRTMLLPAKSSVIGTMQYLIPKANVLPEYLCYVVKYMHLEKYFTGATIPHIYFRDYKNEKFNLDRLDRQIEIIKILGHVEKIIDTKKQELQKLDTLIKARFVEMFGKDKYESKLLSDVADIIAGGDKPSDNTETPTEEYRYPVYANGVDNEGLQCFSNKFRVGKAAVTISARGTIGATFIREPCFTPIVRLISVIPNEEVNVTYLKYAIDSIGISGTGTSQQQLTVPNLKKEFIPVPPKALQEEFLQIVQQVDKSKVVVQKALDKSRLLFDSLMQKYFG